MDKNILVFSDYVDYPSRKREGVGVKTNALAPLSTVYSSAFISGL